MTRSVEEFAESTDLSGLPTGSPEVDALSDILHTVRLRGDTLIRCAPVAPFRIRIPPGLRVLHIAETDGLEVHLEGNGAAITLQAHDMALLARGDAHTIASVGSADIVARDLAHDDLYSPPPSPGQPRWVTGSFAVDNDVAGPLLSVLPPVIVIPGVRQGHEWLPLSLQLLLAETSGSRPGARVMISRILDLLFIHALRGWSGSTRTTPGWLTAALDSQLAPTLTAIHRHPEHPWTIAELASQAKQSPSTFAQRFTRLLGQSPAAYIAERRLDRAAQLLQSTDEPVNRVARMVGYSSDAAFTRAFQRHFGAPPLRWRKNIHRTGV